MHSQVGCAAVGDLKMRKVTAGHWSSNLGATIRAERSYTIVHDKLGLARKFIIHG